MEASVLTSTKKVLGIDEQYQVFDQDILTFINSAFSTLSQLGVGPEEGYHIEGSDLTWAELTLPTNQLNSVRTYIFLKVQMLFDPPTMSFLIEAKNQQIKELEWRLNVLREPNREVPEV